MELDKRQAADSGEGCLVGVIRVPVKIVALIVVLPVRVVWDLLVAFGQAVRRHVLGPLSVYVVQPALRAAGLVLTVLLKLVFVWPWVGSWRFVLEPLHLHVLAPGGRLLYAYLLRPLGEALARIGRGGMRYLLAPLAKGVAWTGWALCMILFVWPWVGLWRYVLAPVGRGLLWLAGVVHRYVLTPVGQALLWLGGAGYRYVLSPVGQALVWLGGAFHQYVLTPVGRALVWLGGAFHRYVLTPVGRALVWLGGVAYRYVLTPVGQVLVWAWHVAGRILRAVWRAVRLVGRVVVGWPVAQVYRHVLTPVGHVVREVWRTVRTTVRQARADVRKALFGGPGREPVRSRARTLGSTTAVSNTPAPESPLPQRQG
ncbi:hypothetical protein ACFXA3_32350 [Streptomyces sp. NPDC059456]|uniref:hypothetical protein n=1 Tax=Streptomyces sp. NPDC059456 TaxID=3346838 RepID=UPI0036874E26